VWILTRILPKPTIDIIADYIKHNLHTAKNRYKVFFPQKEFLSAANKHKDGTFITGHFHTYHVIDNGITIPWAKDGSFMVWHNGKVEHLIVDGSKNKFN
jgi:hypothetical protein